MAKLKIAKIQNDGTKVDQYTGPAKLGGTGGISGTITTTGVTTIAVVYNTAANVQVAHGYIEAQKGTHKFLVANANAVISGSQFGSQQTKITLANVATGALTAGQGTITGYNASNVAFNASRITNRFVYDFAGNKMRYVLSPTVAGNGFANVSSY